MPDNRKLPIINLKHLHDITRPVTDSEVLTVAHEIAEACRTYGFFYICGHGVPPKLESDLERVAKEFFSLSEESKSEISMNLGGKAWRGWFPIGQELTSGLPDQKEGIYLGEDLPNSHPMVLKQKPFYGANLYPNQDFKSVVLSWLKEMRRVGDLLMRGIALSLGLEAERFQKHGMNDPLQLFRIFHYPPTTTGLPWGVGEHTDYGVLTILKQDRQEGLQVKVRRDHSDVWIDVPPIEGTFVINIGDMLEKLTYGHYVSTPHRVIVSKEQSRYSFPYFFDPHFDAKLRPLEELKPNAIERRSRWDHEDVHEVNGSYGAYLLKKVGRVFPALFDQVHP